MKLLPKPLRQYADEAGLVAFVLVPILAIALAAALYFGTPEAVDHFESPPAIPPDLADHQTRGEGLERGPALGATPNEAIPRPEQVLEGQGISYDFKGSTNWSGRGTNPIKAIVVHVTGPGTMAGMASWFNNPISQVSAHFGVGKKGEIHQYVEVGDTAWHAGICGRSDTSNPIIASWSPDSCGRQGVGINPNLQTVGIEVLLAGPAEPLGDFPKAEASLLALLRWLTVELNIEPSRTTIIGHYEIDLISRFTDPRCCIDLDDIVEKLGGSTEPPPVVTVPTWVQRLLRWVMPDLQRFDPSVTACCDAAQWEDAQGRDLWSRCTSWGGRKHLPSGAYVHQGTAIFYPGFAWATAPNC